MIIDKILKKIILILTNLTKVENIFTGKYETYQEAKVNGKELQAKEEPILTKLSDLNLNHRFVIAPILVSAFDKDDINILEVGGGENPIINYIKKSSDKKIYSEVIETKNFCKNISSFFDKNKISDLKYLDNYKKINFDKFDIAYFGSSIQYMPDSDFFLDKIFSSKIKFILILDTFFNLGDKDYYVLHKANKHPNKFFSYKNFHQKFLKKNFKCVFENKKTVLNYRHDSINISEYAIYDLIFKRINS